jgi:hypothetical protein
MPLRYTVECDVQIFRMLRSKNSTLATFFTQGVGLETRTTLAAVHSKLICSLHERYSRLYQEQNSAWLQITSLALSYFYTATTKWTAEPLPDLEYMLVVCYRLATKFQGAGFDFDEVTLMSFVTFLT